MKTQKDIEIFTKFEKALDNVLKANKDVFNEFKEFIPDKDKIPLNELINMFIQLQKHGRLHLDKNKLVSKPVVLVTHLENYNGKKGDSCISFCNKDGRNNHKRIKLSL